MPPEPAVAAVDAASSSLPIVYGGAVLIVVLTLFNYFTRSGTIARATLKEALRQPVFVLLSLIGTLIVVSNIFVPYFSLGEDTKMFIDCGLATILICGLLLSVWTASTSVAEEIEGKTAMTLLSKPINRRQFIVGKYFGILEASLAITLILGTVMFAATYYKHGYDARESGKGQVDMFQLVEGSSIPRPSPERLATAMSILPALALIFFEAALIAACSVAISTRLPMLPNMVTCFAIFVVAHLTSTLVQSTFKEHPFVKFVANLLATVLPALDHLNMSAPIATGKVIPASYVGYNLAYTAAYAALALLMAFIWFEDRDLA